MLDSMIRNPRPTRAEVADVANAIYDGTDAIMLSGETAAGKYPVEAVTMMGEIAEQTERYLKFEDYRDGKALEGKLNVSAAVGSAAVSMVEHIKAACIVTPTMSGQTARLISTFVRAYRFTALPHMNGQEENAALLGRSSGDRIRGRFYGEHYFPCHVYGAP